MRACESATGINAAPVKYVIRKASPHTPRSANALWFLVLSPALPVRTANGNIKTRLTKARKKAISNGWTPLAASRISVVMTVNAAAAAAIHSPPRMAAGNTFP